MRKRIETDRFLPVIACFQSKISPDIQDIGLNEKQFG